MLSLSVQKAMLVLLHGAGVVSALYVFISERGTRSSVLLLCALSLPIPGSVAAIAFAAARLRSRYADSCSRRRLNTTLPRFCLDEHGRAMMS